MNLIVAIILCLASQVARADGASLFRAPPSAPDAATAARINKDYRAKSVVAVVADPSAINSTVINVQLDGKNYRFVGGKAALPPNVAFASGAASAAKGRRIVFTSDASEAWHGKTPEGGHAWIGKSDLGVTGEFFVEGKTFRMIRSALFEVAPPSQQAVRSYDEPTPQMIEAARKRAAERANTAGKQ